MSDHIGERDKGAGQVLDPLRCGSAFITDRVSRSLQDRTVVLREVTRGPVGSLVEWEARTGDPAAVRAVTVVRPGAALDGTTVDRAFRFSNRPGTPAKLYREWFDTRPPRPAHCDYTEGRVRDILRVGLVSRWVASLMGAATGLWVAAAVLLVATALIAALTLPLPLLTSAAPLIDPVGPIVLTLTIGTAGITAAAAIPTYLIGRRRRQTIGLIDQSIGRDWIRVPAGDARCATVCSVLVAAQRAQTCLDRAISGGVAIAAPIVAGVVSLREAAWDLAAEVGLSDLQRWQTVVDAERLADRLVSGVSAAVRAAERARERPVDPAPTPPLPAAPVAVSPAVRLNQRIDELAAYSDAVAEVAAADHRGRNLYPLQGWTP